MTTESEGVKQEVVEDTIEQPVQKEPEYTEAELKAMDLGWRPKEEFNGEEDDFIPAKEFLRRGELFGRINTYKNKIDALEKSIFALKTHNERMFEQTFKKELQDIKVARRAALKEGDTEVVEVLDERLEQVEKEFETQRKEVKKELETPAPAASPHPAWEPWVEGNKWYANNAELRGYADGLAAKIIQDTKAAGGEIQFEKLLGEVSRKVRQKFPENFPSGTERKRTVERASDDAKGKSKAEDADLREVENSLSEGDRQIMETLVKNKHMTKKAYLEQIKELGKRKGR